MSYEMPLNIIKQDKSIMKNDKQDKKVKISSSKKKNNNC